MADRFGAAQPIIDAMRPPEWLMRMLGGATPPPAVQGSSTDSGQLPSAWTAANQESIRQQQQQLHAPVPPKPRMRLPQGK